MDHRRAPKAARAVVGGVRHGAGRGDVGDGTFTGEAFTAVLQPDGVTTIVDAEYHFDGSIHSFTAHIQAVQTRFNNGGVITVSGVITGVVTDRWLKGNVVEGEYRRYACLQGANGFCFDGTLEIERGSKDNDWLPATRVPRGVLAIENG